MSSTGFSFDIGLNVGHASFGSSRIQLCKESDLRRGPRVVPPAGSQASLSSAFGVGAGRQERELGAARIEPRVLHDDGHVGLEDGGIVGVARNGLRVFKVIET